MVLYDGLPIACSLRVTKLYLTYLTSEDYVFKTNYVYYRFMILMTCTGKQFGL